MKKASLILALVSGVLLFGADTAPIPPVATKFLGLFQNLRDAEAQKATGKIRHVSFRFSSSEIDDYMRWSLKATPRPGLDSVTVKIFPHNYISTFAIVDFDAVEKWKPGTIPGILRPVLNGKKSIWVDYGRGRQCSEYRREPVRRMREVRQKRQDLRCGFSLMERTKQIQVNEWQRGWQDRRMASTKLPFRLRQAARPRLYRFSTNAVAAGRQVHAMAASCPTSW